MILLKHINRKLRISYIIVIIAAIILRLTEYSFTFDFLDYLLIAIIIIYPIIEFIRSSVQRSVKIIVGILLAVLAFFIAKTLVFAFAFGSESKHMIQSWKVDRYGIILNRRQGWAGPPYERFDLIKYRLFGLIDKTIAHGYPEHNSLTTCKIQLRKDDHVDKIIYEFDSCAKSIKKIKP